MSTMNTMETSTDSSLPLHTATTDTERILSSLSYFCSTNYLVNNPVPANSYRDRAGKPTCLGVLIPDNKYNPAIEGIPIEGVLARSDLACTVPFYFKHHKSLLHWAQVILNEGSYKFAYEEFRKMLTTVRISKELYAELATANKGG